MPPKGYFEKLQKVFDKHDILFIADEVITGFGRTGHWFATGGMKLKPDIVTLAKGITSAYFPVSASVISEKIWNVLKDASAEFGPVMHGFTYSGHPVACAVALRNIAMIEDEDLPANARARGDQLLTGLRRLLDHDHVGNVRGRGLMALVEVVADKETKAKYDPSLNIGGKLTAATRGRGLIVRCSNDGIAMSPPLVISEQEIDELLTIVEEAIREVCA